MITLNGISLPTALWWDEFNYSAIKQSKTETPSGHVILQRGAMLEGRPIELTGSATTTWLTRSELQSIVALFNDPEPLTLSYRGTTYTVKVALHESDYFVAKPLRQNRDALSASGMYYIETLKLIEVLA